MASLMHPAHPLMQAVTDLLLEQSRSKLKQGAVLIDPVDTGTEPHVMFLVDHSVRQGGDSGRTISRVSSSSTRRRMARRQTRVGRLT